MRTVRKSEHNAYQIYYHFVIPVKYRLSIFNNTDREYTLSVICKEIEERYSIEFEELGIEQNHVHFLVSVSPKYSPSRIIQIIKSITARKLFKKYPEIKEELWGGEFWTDGFFVATVGEYANKDIIKQYVKNQGRKIEDNQFKLFNF